MSFILILRRNAHFPGEKPELLDEGSECRVAWYDASRLLMVHQDASISVLEFPDYLVVTDGEYVEDLKDQIGAAICSDPRDLAKIVRGNAVVIPRRTEDAFIVSDVLGSFPLFHLRDPKTGTLVYSTILKHLARLSDNAADMTGIYQYLAAGYCIGSRSLLEGIEQFLPGESHHVLSADDEWTIERGFAPNPWAAQYTSALDDALIESAIAVLTRECGRLRNCHLMFSAGWDSRTILAGMMASRVQDSIVAYSHGDLQSREIRIASQICRDHGLKRETKAIADLGIDLGTYQRGLDSAGHSLFPHWLASAEYARDHGRASLSAGIYGGVLGGHYSVPSIAHGATNKLRSLLRYLYFSKGSSLSGLAALETAYEMLLSPLYIRWWCLRDELCNEMQNAVMQENADDTRQELERLHASGVESLESLVESFQVGHRGRQYMNGQLGICRGTIPIINPLSHAELAMIACGLPLAQKVHNQVNKQILKRIAPSLLRYPMAATLVPAGSPVGLQELSRGVRKAVESARWKIYKRAGKHATHNPNMGWVNFEHLRKQPLFHELIDSLAWDAWDKENMRRVVNEYPSSSIHPLYDMLCKIKTIDYAVDGNRA